MEQRMSKKEKKNRKTEREIARSKKYSMLLPAAVVIFGAGIVIALVFFFPRSEPWSLPAIPRNPRPATLSPELFTGKVATVYRIARDVPGLQERVPCYCGCYVNPGRQNNLDCYTDRHSVG